MGNVFKKKQSEIEIADFISKKDLLKYPHLNLRGEIIIRKDVNSYIPEIDLRFENYFPATARVWSNDFNASSICPAESDISFSEIIPNSNSF